MPPAPESGVSQQTLSMEDLFRLHAPAVSAVGLAMLQNAEEADDLVQDVFLRAFRALDRLRNREEAKPWLMTIAIRLARTRLRRRKRTTLLFLPEEPDFDAIAATAVQPEHRELLAQLANILEKLPPELRVAWVLRYVQSETVEGVAAIRHWSLSTAKRRIRAANDRVLSRLESLSRPRRRFAPPSSPGPHPAT